MKFIGKSGVILIGDPNLATATSSVPEYSPTDVTYGAKYDPVGSALDSLP